MWLYSISLFLHIGAALALAAALALELAGISGLRRAASTAQAAEWMRLLGSTRRVAGPAALVLLVTGMHLGATRWGPQAWIIVGLSAMVLMAILGPALGGRRFAAIGRALQHEPGPVSPAGLGRLVHDPVITLSIGLRMGLFGGIVFLMSTKPGLLGSLAAIGAAAALGAAAVRSTKRGRSGGPVEAMGSAVELDQGR